MRALTLISLLLSTLVIGCDDPAAEEGAAAEEQQGPIFAPIDLPISRRLTPAPPSNAILIEASLTEARVDGTKVVDLERGIFPEADVTTGVSVGIAAAIRGGAARNAAVIAAPTNYPYKGLVTIIDSLAQSNVHQVAIKVRTGPSTLDTAYVDISKALAITADETTQHRFEGAMQKRWGQLVQAWGPMYEGCRERDYVDCDPAPTNALQDGDLQMTLRIRGSALKVELQRMGGEAPTEQAAPQRAEMLDGVPDPSAPAAEGPPPRTEGAFTWRFKAAHAEHSPVTSALRPLCGSDACAVVFAASERTSLGKVVAFLGVAFPTGTPAPHIAFRKVAN